ncbi:hypothetical protein PENSTE_c040G10396 [Penicillium steckii]|uniref:Uncharacterized protein n=1 Tax=Penicillium steckii TaxID=303698 RepID=A0A1V6SIT6_9EURO|nr:hypothetical protein PENSTE_c040G10396 [Penicillium steckii]
MDQILDAFYAFTATETHTASTQHYFYLHSARYSFPSLFTLQVDSRIPLLLVTKFTTEGCLIPRKPSQFEGGALPEIVIPGRRHFYTELSRDCLPTIRLEERMPWIADTPENDAPPESVAGTSENHQSLENPVMLRYLASR